jgi:predicted CoA-binding protein
MNPGDEELREILRLSTIAVVGCSPNPDRPSHAVAAYLQAVGYRVIPVNPGQSSILGEKCYPNLSAVPEKVDIVDLFRKSEEVFPLVQEAIRIGAKVVWMQDGVEHEASAQAARAAGLKVVMNDCLLRVHRRLNGPFRKTITTC